LEIRDVRQRVYRGFCRPDVDQAALAKLFNDQKEAIWALYQGMEGLDEGVKKRSLDYYEDFYKILNDPRRYDREVTRACQKIPS
jgi:fructosamine-3-kinase